MGSNDENDILGTARSVLETQPMCDRCLGRQFAWLSTDTSNEERGRSIKLTLSMKAHNEMKEGRKENGTQLLALLAGNGMFGPAQTLAKRDSIDFPVEKSCYLCSVDDGSLFDRLDSIAEEAVLAVEGFEFGSFLVGSVPTPILSDREDEIRSALKILHGETLKADFNRELGKRLQKLLDKPVEFDNPDIVIIHSMIKNRIKVRVNPLFMAGRYRKLVRGVPQSRWDCKSCKGKGCEECGGTGRKYPDSISEYVGIPAQDMTGGTKFKFHAAGREDIDVLMLGSGRPFVVEVSEPKVRNPDLKKLAKRIRKDSGKKLEVLELAVSNRKRAQVLKDEASENVKDYGAIIRTEEEVTKEDLRRVCKEFKNADISQRTPKRVAHRRSDLVRTKRIIEIQLEKKSNHTLKGFLKVQGGTYVKELVSGDDGRTTPSLAERLGTACECLELDVLEIHDGNRP